LSVFSTIYLLLLFIILSSSSKGGLLLRLIFNFTPNIRPSVLLKVKAYLFLTRTQYKFLLTILESLVMSKLFISSVGLAKGRWFYKLSSVIGLEFNRSSSTSKSTKASIVSRLVLDFLSMCCVTLGTINLLSSS